ncbi:MAG: GIY-YIG nuclease family protein [Oligoflexia bacterium]|nr:GIY-YIG nuclease family protein [Oligoflexia bacterium]
MNLVKKFYVYILCNNYKNVIYVGQTSDLKKRIYFHKNKLIAGFTKKYNVDRLVYYEGWDTLGESIDREKKIKKYDRKRKVQLIITMNPEWIDLYNHISQ